MSLVKVKSRELSHNAFYYINPEHVSTIRPRYNSFGIMIYSEVNMVNGDVLFVDGNVDVVYAQLFGDAK